MFAVFFPVSASHFSFMFGAQIALLVALAVLVMGLFVEWARKPSAPSLKRTSAASILAAGAFYFVMVWDGFPFWGWPF